MADKKITLTFYGGTESVTGANFLLDGGAGERVLVDCGLLQGSKVCDDFNRGDFPYDPASVDALFVTHALLDHVGRIPKLVHDGFAGVIYSTPPTKEIGELMLLDSRRIFEKEVEPGTPPLYTEADVSRALSLWQTIDYHKPVKVGSLTVVAKDAGHILGSAMYEFRSANNKAIVFTGDLGNSPTPLLRDTEPLGAVAYAVMESVYGDRNHEDRQERRDKLEDIIEETMRAGGTLLIPAFSIERTQELLFEIETMMEESRIPLVPVFLDSPLGIKVTKVYRDHLNYLNENVRDIARLGDGVLKFPQLHLTLSTEESKAILKANPRKIIIAGSGMSIGGRIIHHEKEYLSGLNNTLLLVGYQSPGSLGRILQDGASHVRIFGENVAVRARVTTINGYSSHKDSQGLLELVRASADSLQQVFVVMGEPRAALFLVQRIRDYLGVSAIAPKQGQSVEILL